MDNIIDIHSHLYTPQGWPLTQEEIEALQNYYKMKVEYKTEEQAAETHRVAGLKTILAVSPNIKDFEQLREYHSYVAEVTKNFPDVFVNAWALAPANEGLKGFRETERCIGDLNMFGIAFSPIYTGLLYTDKANFPFYELCVEANKPAMIYVGMTGIGAGTPGGRGITMDDFHPRYVDAVAAAFPDLLIVASHPAWPWETEMVMVVLHKSNVYHDLHGWSPKYIDPVVKREMKGRLRGRYVTGMDYPMMNIERTLKEWEEELTPEILTELLYENPKRALRIEV